MHRYIDVNIKVVYDETQDVECSFDLSFKDLLAEIEENYRKYIEAIREMNSELLKSKTVSRIVKLYEILMKLLEE